MCSTGPGRHGRRRIARRQQSAGGGLVAFELKGGLDAGRRVLNGLKLARIAVSLGDPGDADPASGVDDACQLFGRGPRALWLVRRTAAFVGGTGDARRYPRGPEAGAGSRLVPASAVAGLGVVSGRGVRGVAAPGQPFALAQPIPGRAPPPPRPGAARPGPGRAGGAAAPAADGPGSSASASKSTASKPPPSLGTRMNQLASR